MRFIGKTVKALAIISCSVISPAAVTAQETGHRIAVVDVAYIFKNHPGNQVPGFDG